MIKKPEYDEIKRFGLSFTTVINESIDGLSANALAAYVYLMSKPPDWIIRTTDVRTRFDWGDYTWRKVSKELREKGLMFDMTERDSVGKVLKKSVCLGSQPIESIPLNINDVAEQRRGESTPLVIKDSLQMKEVIQKAFDEFWQWYPKKVNKKKAMTQFSKLSKEQQEQAISYLKTKPFEGTERQFIMDPTTYINGERWEDEPPKKKKGWWV